MTKSALTDANNKYAPDGIDHVVCDFRQFVDSENSFNLSKQSTQEPEVASCDSGDARHRLSVCEVRPIELQAELLHVACEHERWFIAERWTIVMGEADSAVELRVAGHALFDAWHNDQDRAGVLAIEDITHLLQSGSVETLRFLRNHELQVFPGHRALLCAPMLASAEADAAEQLVDL